MVRNERRLRVVLCDYSGHPFQSQLSRELARRGHTVLHLHFAEFQTPKGRLEAEASDPSGYSADAISLGRAFSKHSLVRRRRDEIEVGGRFARRIDQFAPDVVIGCNLPLDALAQVIRECRSSGRGFVFWQQDIYSIGIERILRNRFGWPGLAAGWHYRRIERRALNMSDAIVVISPDFPAVLSRQFGVGPDRIHVVENWAPLDEIEPLPKDNAWSRAIGIHDKEVVLYTGTLGMKHNPELLLRLGRSLEARNDAVLVVTSEGPAADWLAREARNCSALRVMPFQPYAVYPKVLASGNVLVSVLEPDAGAFSVPSKVLSYMCAARPIVLYGPPENLASRLLVRSGAGYVVGNCRNFAELVHSLLDDPDACKAAGAAGRRHAQDHFAIGEIADRFEAVLLGATARWDRV